MKRTTLSNLAAVIAWLTPFFSTGFMKKESPNTVLPGEGRRFILNDYVGICATYEDHLTHGLRVFF